MNAWGVKFEDDTPIYVVLFVSRKKDNKDIPNYKERRKAFVAHLETNEQMERLYNDFKYFSNQGQIGEMSRLYISVNTRDMRKTSRDLIHFLIDNIDFNLCSAMGKIAEIAALKENAVEKKWMFDFDLLDYEKMQEFCQDIKNIDETIEIEINNTPHGFAIITNRSFDTRFLEVKWSEIATLKRDDLLCLYWTVKEK